MKLGIIGLDSSHAYEFTRILRKNQSHCQVEIAYAGVPSDDFEMSCGRINQISKSVFAFGVREAHSIEEVMEVSDAIFLEQVDARKRLETLRHILPYGKPVFVDKPFALTPESAKELTAQIRASQTPVFSCSSLRYSQGLNGVLHGATDEIWGADLYGPLPLEPTQNHYYWYGVHVVDMLYRIFHQGCQWVEATHTEEHTCVVAMWADGKIGTLRGNRRGNLHFGGVLHHDNGQYEIHSARDSVGYYETLLDEIIDMFEHQKTPIALEEMYEITCFMQAVNESMDTGKRVYLSDIERKEAQ